MTGGGVSFSPDFSLGDDMWDWLSGLGKSIGGAGKSIGAGVKKPFDILAGHGGNSAMGDGGGAMAAMGGFKPPITTPGFNPSASMPELSGMSPTFKSPVNLPMTASAGPDIRERLSPTDLPVQPNMRLPNAEGLAMDRQAPRFDMPLGQAMGGTATAAPSGYVDPIEAKRAAYVQKDMEIPRWKRVLRDAALGGAQGVAHRRPGDNIAGSLLGGMAAGGVAQGVAPRMVAEGRYEGLQQPRDEASMEREVGADRQRLAMENLRRQQDLTNSQIKENEAQGSHYKVQEELARKEQARKDKLASQPSYQATAGIGIWDKSTGQVKTPATPKPATVQRPMAISENAPYIMKMDENGNSVWEANPGYEPREDRADAIPKAPESGYAAMAAVQELKATAESAWNTAKSLPDGPDKTTAVQVAQAALDAYNKKVAALGETYAPYFETGQGEGGWNYAKARLPQKKQRGGRAQSGIGVPTRDNKAIQARYGVNLQP